VRPVPGTDDDPGHVDTNLVLHDFRDMSKRNVTVSLDEETARWARVEAARRDTSVSRLLGDLLREHMERERSYEASMQRWRAGPVRRLERGARYPSREEVHRRGNGT